VAEALDIWDDINPLPGSDHIYPSQTLDEHRLKPLHASFLQNFAFLAPEQKRCRQEVDLRSKSDIYSFGVLVYYLLTGVFPEGYFEMPSEVIPDFKWNWDLLVKTCLRRDPDKRPEWLMPVLKSVKDTKPSSTLTTFNHGVDSSGTQAHPEAGSYQVHAQEKNEEISIPVQSSQVSLLEASEAAILKPVLQEAVIERPKHDPDPSLQFAVEHGVKHYEPVKREISHIEPLLTDMVVIKGTSYEQGSYEGGRDEIPRHRVNISSFAIDIHPVINEQFVRFLEALGGEKDSNHNDIIRLKDSRIKKTGGRYSIESGYSKHPVVGVTWYGAVAYAKWVGKRLPTEAEWELAAKGGDENSLYPTGADIEKSQANFFSSDTTPAMSYPPNCYGLYDMAGNVYEWCQDWYGYNYYETSVQEPDDPKGPLQGVYRVLRGGCWKSLREDLRCCKRHRNNPGTVNSTYGFRCATDVEEKEH
jgi:formylglycine-generating enzyme required for sulfatase activity